MTGITSEELFNKIEQDLYTLANMLRQKEFDNYSAILQNQCYNPKPLLNALQKAQNAVEDLKQYVYKW